MNKRSLFLLLATLLLSLNSFSQQIVEGMIKDFKTGEVLPFVNIAIVGQPIGTISDVNGEFKLTIPSNLTNNDLAISSVGYTPKTYKISDIYNQRIEVMLESVVLKIDEVVVTDKSEAGRKMLKNVVSNLNSNFISQPFSYIGVYQSSVSTGTTKKTSTFKFTAYDSKGYNKEAFNNPFASLNFKFTGVERNFKVDNYESGVVNFDLINSFDVLRYYFNFMNPDYFSDFDFRIKSETEINGEAVSIIEFNCENPSLLTCGALYPQKYNGTITVNKSNFDVLSCEYTMLLNNFSMLAQSLMVDEQNSAEISAKIVYEKTLGKTSMKNIDSQIKIKNKSGVETIYSDNINVEYANFKVPTKVDGKVFYSR
ncbi:MAG: carboxypeptidase-like regulatory domain-containing protein [Bacteroidales bacterium]|nr:carboxypeptidase-like regulatory domain-containing protein [Bacteroidales bacterium]